MVLPFFDIDIKHYDLSIESRDARDDQVTLEDAKSIKEHKVEMKCGTIIPDESRVEEFELKKIESKLETNMDLKIWIDDI